MSDPFIEVTCDGQSVLVAVSTICLVKAETKTLKTCVITGNANVALWVSESYEEVKKRLGIAITPRAETLAVLR
jgi:hypothetical protein